MIGEIVLTVAAGLWFFDMIPQLIKTYRRKSAEGLSYVTFGVSAIAYLLFQIGNFLTNNYFYFLIYIPPACVTFILFALMVKYRNKTNA